nr:hypothetical protein [Mycobacterium pseudoshottsii]
MSRPHQTGLGAAAAAWFCVSLCFAPPAYAGEVAAWNGDYILTLAANAKTGTSRAPALLISRLVNWGIVD